MTNSISAADVLKTVINDHQISKRDLVDRLGISVTYLQNLLTRKSFLNLVTATKIEKVLGISALYLLKLDLDYQGPKMKAQIDQLDVDSTTNYLVPYYWAHEY